MNTNDLYELVLKKINDMHVNREKKWSWSTEDYNKGYLIALENLESWLENEVKKNIIVDKDSKEVFDEQTKKLNRLTTS